MQKNEVVYRLYPMESCSLIISFIITIKIKVYIVKIKRGFYTYVND